MKFLAIQLRRLVARHPDFHLPALNVQAAIRILAAGTEKKRVESGRKRIGS
jgi:hypothetical protein